MGRGKDRHLRLEDPRGIPPSRRRDGDRPAPERRGGLPRADQHGRVRDGLLDREQLRPPDPQSLGPGAHPGRLLRGERGRGLLAHGPRRPGLRHGRLDPAARGLLRDRGVQADLRPGVPVWPRGVRLVARPDRSADGERLRCRADLSRPRRRRPSRFDDVGGGAGRPGSGARARDRAAARRVSRRGADRGPRRRGRGQPREGAPRVRGRRARG